MRVYLIGMGQIVVVDDALEILEAMQYVLEDAGYSVRTSQRGEYAEHLIDSKKLPSLLILDMLLSGKDGRDICRELKENAVTKHMPIIMISAHPAARLSIKKVGADAFLPKPFDIDILLHTVKRFVYTS